MEQINNVYSDLKILVHTEKVKDILDGRRTAPIYVRIKPTNVCNQKCWYCVYADDAVIENREVNRRESIPWEKLQEIIQDLSDIGTKAITFSGGGEPLCYPNIIDALHLVQDNGLDYAMISNGQALEEEARKALANANWLRISLDSANEETYERIRGVKTYRKVLTNIERFADEKSKDCTLGVNCVVTKDNYTMIYELCRILSEIGVNNVKFSPLMVKGKMPEYHYQIESHVKEQIIRAKEDVESQTFKVIDKYSNDESLKDDFIKCPHCYISEVFTVIGADCRVYFCHQRAYTESGMIGDISNRSFRDVWFSEEITQKLRKLNPQEDCNFRCAFEERNRLLESLVNIDKRHVNFI